MRKGLDPFPFYPKIKTNDDDEREGVQEWIKTGVNAPLNYKRKGKGAGDP